VSSSIKPAVSTVLTHMKAMAETESPPPGNDRWLDGIIAGVYRAPAGATQFSSACTFNGRRSSEVRWADVFPHAGRPPAPATRCASPPSTSAPPAAKPRWKLPPVRAAHRTGRAPEADLLVLAKLSRTPTPENNSPNSPSHPRPSNPILRGAGEKKHNSTSSRPGGARRHPLQLRALIAPDGSVAGKYRKTCLPRSEIDGGIAPGSDYPILKTRFGKVGLMICYTASPRSRPRAVQSRRGSITWPVWAATPARRARACENHIYLVSSTTEPISSDWMISAVFDHTGEPIAHAKEWGTVAWPRSI